MLRYLLLLLMFCTIAGCKKELSYSYAFSVGGTAYNGYNYFAYYKFDTTAALHEFAANFYFGNAADSNYVQVSFSGNNYVVPGTYYSGVVNPNNTVCSFAAYQSHVYYSNVSGIVQVQQIDTVGHNIKGNFQFNAVSTVNASDTLVITNGAFSGIHYVIE
jgi:hypothetical protein